MRTRLAGLALAAVAAFGTVVLVARPATAQPDDAVEPAGTQPDDRSPDHRSPDHRRERLEARLDRLVEEGVITPERAAEIKQRLTERAERMAERRSARQVILEDLAATLDLTTEEMLAALRAGSSLADLAADAGIDPAVLVDKLVAEATTRLDAAVAEGALDRARADELLEDIEARITARVNGERPERHGGSGRFGGDPGAFRDRFEGFGGRPGFLGGHPGHFGRERPGD